MKLVSAVMAGFFAGFVFYAFAWMLFMEFTSSDSEPYLFFLFIAAWIISSFSVYKGAESPECVWARGALVGAAEWLLAGFVTAIMGSRIWLGAQKGVALGAGRMEIEGEAAMISAIWLGLCFVLSILCLLMWFFLRRTNMGREIGTNISETFQGQA